MVSVLQMRGTFPAAAWAGVPRSVMDVAPPPTRLTPDVTRVEGARDLGVDRSVANSDSACVRMIHVKDL